MEQAKKRNHKFYITDITIEKVLYLEVPDLKQFAALIQQKHRKLLEIAKEVNDSNEVGILYNLYTKEEVIKLGNENNVSIDDDIDSAVLRKNSYKNELILLHNHPSTSNFSLADIAYFLSDDYILAISVITNQGQIYFLQKNEKYDYNRAYELLHKLIREYSVDKQELIVKEFLKICREGGINYVKGK